MAGEKIKQLLRTLTIEQKEQLKCAHQYCVATYISLPGNIFIGVYCNGARHLLIEESHNNWYTGRICYPQPLKINGHEFNRNLFPKENS